MAAAAPHRQEQIGPRRLFRRPFFAAAACALGLWRVHFSVYKAVTMGRRPGVLPLPRPSTLPGVRFPKVPESDPSLPECIAQLDDWAATINEMDAGGSSCVRFSESALPPTMAQLHVVETASAQIGRFASTPAVESDTEAFTAVCGGLDYGASPANFEPLQEALLSLRPKGARPRPLLELAGAGAQFTCGDENLCVLPNEEATRNLHAAELVSAFMDPGLRRSKKLYHRLLRRLRESGMIDFVPTGEPGAVVERVGVFAVAKKDGRQRLVVDCRRSNCWFQPPPKAKLPTCASYSRLSMPAHSTLYSGGFDLRDAFYQLELPARLRPYFCLDDCCASLCPELAKAGYTTITPRFAVVPMGWTHALNICQDLFTSVIKEALGPDTIMLDDNLPAPALDQACVSCYVDNFGVLSTNPALVRSSVHKVKELCDMRGLQYHELEECQEGFEYLGMVGTSKGIISIKGKRRRRLYQAIRHTLRRGSLSSRQLEKLVGHFVSQGLLRRECLSILRAVYTFIKRKFKQGAALWPAVVRELQWMKAMLPVMEVDIAKPWAEKLFCFDASEWGEGITFSYQDGATNQDIGRYSERWRFKDGEPPPRVAAHQQIMDVLLVKQEDGKLDEYLRSLDTKAEDITRGRRRMAKFTHSVAEHIDTSHRVPLVPSSVVVGNWVTVSSKPWQRREHISVLETRASVGMARLVMSDLKLHGKHIVYLSDSMAQLLGSSKGRSSAPGMCRCLRQLAAAVLCCNATVHGRWIPSEVNPSDDPSRRGIIKQCVAQEATSNLRGEGRAIGATRRLFRSGDECDAALPSHRRPPGLWLAAEDPAQEAASTAYYELSPRAVSEAPPLAEPTESRSAPSVAIQGRRDRPRPDSCRDDSSLSAGEAAVHTPGVLPDVVCFRMDSGSDSEDSSSGSQAESGGTGQSSGRRRRRRGRGVDRCRTSLGRRRAQWPEADGGFGLGETQVPQGRRGEPSSQPGRVARTFQAVARCHPTAATGARRLRDGEPNGRAPRQRREGPQRRPLRDCRPSPLPPARRVSKDPVGVDRARGPRKPRARPAVLDSAAPIGRASAKQSRTLRRDPPRGSGASGLGAPKVPRPTPQRPVPAAHKPPVQQVLATSRPRSAARQEHRRAAPVCAKAQRAVSRPAPSASAAQRGKVTRPVAGRQQREKVPERRPLSGEIKCAHCRDATVRASVRKAAVSGPQRAFVAALQASRLTGFPVIPIVLELYAGTGRFSAAAARAGFFVLSFDWGFGPDFDLGKPKVQHLILGWIRAGYVAFLLAGIPCQSWSRARMQPGGLQMLRDLKHILGLPVLKHESERWKIVNGNKAMDFCSRVAHALLGMSVPFIFENPWTSLLWEAPQMQHLRRRKFVRMARADFCQWGMPWRKATGLLCGFANVAPIDRRCSGCRGTCSRSGKPHQQLSGVDPSTKQFWTHVAEPYPRGLCTAMVQVMVDATRQLRHNNLGATLGF